MRRCQMKPLTKYVGMVLAQYANSDGTNAFPAVAKLARVTCLSERSVRTALTELRGLGLIKRVQKGGMRGTQAIPDVHCLVIPADLLERFDLLTPGEEEPVLPTPNRQEVPPGNDPNRHVTSPNRHVDVAQPANDDTPTGTTCLLPISTYLPGDLDSPTDDSGFATRPTTGPDLDAIKAELQRIDELDALRQRKAAGQ
jgi:hypothetical protein